MKLVPSSSMSPSPSSLPLVWLEQVQHIITISNKPSAIYQHCKSNSFRPFQHTYIYIYLSKILAIPCSPTILESFLKNFFSYLSWILFPTHGWQPRSNLDAGYAQVHLAINLHRHLICLLHHSATITIIVISSGTHFLCTFATSVHAVVVAFHGW